MNESDILGWDIDITGQPANHKCWSAWHNHEGSLWPSFQHCKWHIFFSRWKHNHIWFQEVAQDELAKNCFPGENLLKFRLRPLKQQGFDRSDTLQKLDFDSLVEETQTLLASKLNESVATGHVEKGHDRTEFASSATSVRLLSTSSSVSSTDLIRSPQRNFFSKVFNPFREMLDAVGVPSLTSEESGVTLKQLIQMKRHKVTHKDYEVVFLGTGASIPSKYRNVSSTLINMR